ncbi:MAG: Uma2 family endonuclease [Dolichospermum sp. DET50]|nr:Uma2 family endonuclease [Dolichospermum sp. DET66]MBS3035307.1 Uma2 family endonuclease [Dolichospermum sp. DET67]MBS3040508.1 Uma2 family endonuclease [Dolichospermum sp. DET50]QSX67647.1 MAG: Uma2 family endonuclease [Dolichospermum sp. DET69]
MITNLIPQLDDSIEEQRIIINNVTWQQYETLRATLDNIPGLRMTYLEGTLELMNPSKKHELDKKTIARLVEIYVLEMDIDLTGYGSTTFRKQIKARGLEPDECYCFGQIKEVPDIAIEVVLSSGGIDKLSVYQGLAIPEVWFWQNNQFAVYHLRQEGYELINRSEFLPELDLTILAQYVQLPHQTQAVKAYRDSLR